MSFAEAIRKEVSIPVIAVGLITEPQQAEDILREGKADMVALARAFISDPRWPWRAAAALARPSLTPPPPLRPSSPQPSFSKLHMNPPSLSPPKNTLAK